MPSAITCKRRLLAIASIALTIIDGKAKVISDNLCDGLGACIGECPQDALKIIEREEEKVQEKMRRQGGDKPKPKKDW